MCWHESVRAVYVTNKEEEMAGAELFEIKEEKNGLV